MKKIVNEDFELEVTPNTIPGGPAWTPGNPNLTSDATLNIIKANYAFANEKKILLSPLTWIMIPGKCKLSGYTHISGLSINPIISTAQFPKCDTIPILLENDSGLCNGVFTQGTTSLTCSCTFKISKSGQDKVQGE